MKPLYLIMLMYASFITGLSDGLAWAFTAIPGIGIVLAIAVSTCINITMGSGLLILLISNKMLHPKFGRFGVVAGAIPPFNMLPIWIALVSAGIAQKMGEEKTALGAIARIATATNPTSLANPVGAVKSAGAMVQAAQSAPQRSLPANDNQPQTEQRAPLGLKSPSMNRDVKPYVPKAA